jgi:hypothetical protein
MIVDIRLLVKVVRLAQMKPTRSYRSDKAMHKDPALPVEPSSHSSGDPEDRVLPDLESCRAWRLTDQAAECLVDKPARCPYAMPFGYRYLCGHPDRATITGRT